MSVMELTVEEWAEFQRLRRNESFTIGVLVEESHRVSKENGWWPVWARGEPQANFPEKLMLVVSELSEALEEYRKGKGMTEVYYPDCLACAGATQVDHYHVERKPEGVPIEIADALIRIFDLAGYWNIDLQRALEVKMNYNATREFRHGGKLA